jgi:L-histidine N-alpha-methyltransferase
MELGIHQASSPGRATNQRLFFLEVPLARSLCFASAVMDGLSRTEKRLSSRFLYDEEGSRIFDEITALPEYYLSRCEDHILATRAPEIVDCLAPGFSIVELGSGSSAKTRHLIRAALAKQKRLVYAPIDISAEHLKSAAQALVHEYDGLLVAAVAGEYTDALHALAPSPWNRLYLFLGSNLGNYEGSEARRFLRTVASVMGANDRLLVGIDLDKDEVRLNKAYNDPQGVTARFNKNILARINRELKGGFDLETFDHRAPYLRDKGHVEMRLVSKKKQRVQVGALKREFQFERGEPIRTEVSVKYTDIGFASVCKSAGLACHRWWSDPHNDFRVLLLAKAI